MQAKIYSLLGIMLLILPLIFFQFIDSLPGEMVFFTVLISSSCANSMWVVGNGKVWHKNDK